MNPSIRTLCAILALSMLLAIAPEAASQFERRLSSEHFDLHYNSGRGRDAVSGDYALLVQSALEDAYGILVTAGFPIFDEPIQVDILDNGSDELGAEYLMARDDGTFEPWIEVATEAVMTEMLPELFVDMDLEGLVRSTAAHELFHVIQDFAALQGWNDMSEMGLVEGQATAIQEFVVPEANDYIDWGTDFLAGPDSMSFLDRDYDTGIFWVYAMTQYGGLSLAEQVMRASYVYDGWYVYDQTFRAVGTTFDTVWADFVVAWATATLPDQKIVTATLERLHGRPSKKSSLQASIDPLSPVVRARWTGEERRYGEVTEVSAYAEYSYFGEDPVGSPLRVAHAYGIDLVAIEIASSAPLRIRVVGDPETDFHIAAIGSSDGDHVVLPFDAEAALVVSDPVAYDRLLLVITRGLAGAGTYSLQLSSN